MITIKKRHNIDDPILIDYINKFNNVVRYSYNRIIKDKLTKSSDLENNVKQNMNNIERLDASWIKSAVKKSTELKTDTKLYFGGKANFIKRKYKKIGFLDKNLPLEMFGSSSDKGNRKAKLDGNVLEFKPARGIKYKINLDLSKNERRMLNIIEDGCKFSKNYFNFKINQDYVYISFNEPVLEKHTFKKNRYLGIDLNPNWIAISIMDNGVTEIYKELIDLRLLNDCKKNKKEYELSLISKHIVRLSKGYNVGCVCIEELKIKSSDKKLGKRYNKLVNNDWNRTYFVKNLIKWLNINSIRSMKVNAYYSSFIGQMKNMEDYDSVAASKEIAYRVYLIDKLGVGEYTRKGFIFNYNKEFLSSLVSTYWKEMLPELDTYMYLYNHFNDKKKSKNSYRFLFNDVEKRKWSCFRLGSRKSKIDLIRF